MKRLAQKACRGYAHVGDRVGGKSGKNIEESGADLSWRQYRDQSANQVSNTVRREEWREREKREREGGGKECEGEVHRERNSSTYRKSTRVQIVIG